MMNSSSIASRELNVFRSKDELEAASKEGKELGQRILCLRARNVDKLLMLLKTYKVWEKSRSVYHSTGYIYWEKIGLAINEHEWKDFAVEHRVRLDRWLQEYDNAFVGEDFVIDLDSEDGGWQEAYPEAKKIRDYFKDLHIPFSINFSGKKGFHIRVFWGDINRDKLIEIPRLVTPLGLQRTYVDAMKRMRDDLKLKCLDTSVAQRRQPLRVPYSIHNSGYVCLPLEEKEFEEFIPVMALPKNVIRLNLYDKELYKNVHVRLDGKTVITNNRESCKFPGDAENIKKLFDLEMAKDG